MFRLDHLNGPNRGKRRIVERRRYDAGSDLSCQLWAPAEQGLAPRHAEFEDTGEAVRIRAFGDAAVRVNGRTVAEAELREGDRVEIGPLALRFSRRRRRARDFRWLPLVAAGIAAAGYGGGQMARQWRAGRAAAAREAERETIAALRATGFETAEFRAMETVAERIEAAENEELDRVRSELERQRERPPSPPPPPESPAERPPDDPPAALAAARRLAAEGRAPEAEAALDRLLSAHPDFAEARAERARLLEEQARPAEALREWRRLFELGPESHWHAVAAGEILRLGRATETPPPPPAIVEAAPPPRPPPPPPSLPRPKLRFETIEQRRFPASADYEEMRIVRAIVAAAPHWRPEDLPRARVEFVFYDAAEGDSAAAPTRARTTPNPRWLRDAPRDEAGRWTVTASYIVPHGLRERERRAFGRARQYRGFLVQAFVGDEWQATEARPRALAERRPARAP